MLYSSLHSMDEQLILRTKATKIAQENERYNQRLMFTNLPEETIHNVLLQDIQLEDSVNSYAALHYSCKHFSKILPFKSLPKIYAHYNQEEKNAAMEKLLNKMNDEYSYYNKRETAALLICLGADNDAIKSNSLLAEGCQHNDKNMISFLLNHGVDSHQKSPSYPDFYHLETVECAKVFNTYKINWNEFGNMNAPNVLWKSLSMNDHSSLELIKFYLDQGVSLKQTNTGNSNLLHHLLVQKYHFNTTNCREIANLLVTAAPELVNDRDMNNQSPIDLAKEFCNRPGRTQQQFFLFNSLVRMFKVTANNL